jgi:hypothetical protein
LNSPEAILHRGWDGLVDLLDRAKYVRYDFSTATKLLDVSNALILRYGTIKQMITQSATPAVLSKLLQQFKGVGPVTARIFVREVRPFWNVIILVRCIAMEGWIDLSCILLLHEESRQAHRYPIATYGGWYAHTDVLGLRK